MNECKNIRSYIEYQIYLYNLKPKSVERATGIKLNTLRRFKINFTGPSLRELCELLSIDEADLYSRYTYLPKEFLDMLFDNRIMRFFLFLCRTNSKNREEIFKVLEQIQELSSQESSEPE